MARTLLDETYVETRPGRLIGVRHLWAGTRRTVVVLTRNEGESVAGHCFLEGAERPIIDGPTAGWVLAAIEDSFEALLLARCERQLADVDECD